MKCDKQGQIGCRKSLQYVGETPFKKTTKKRGKTYYSPKQIWSLTQIYALHYHYLFWLFKSGRLQQQKMTVFLLISMDQIKHTDKLSSISTAL